MGSQLVSIGVVCFVATTLIALEGCEGCLPPIRPPGGDCREPVEPVCHCDASGCETIEARCDDLEAHLNHGDVAAECVPAPDGAVAGNWVGSIALSPYRVYTLAFVPRADGSLLGYVLGGTPFRSVIEGRQFDNGDGTVDVELTIEKVDSQQTEHVLVTGTVDGDTFSGTTSGGDFTLTRQPGGLIERNFFFIRSVPEGQDDRIHLSVAIDEGGEFVSGGFVSVSSCTPFACGGGVDSFAVDAAGNATITIETRGGDGGVQTTGTLEATWNPARETYDTTFVWGSGDGMTTGELRGFEGMGTHTDDLRDVLRAFAALADDAADLSTSIPAPHPSFAASFRHNGQTANDVVQEFEAERAGQSQYDVEFSGFASLRTRVHLNTSTLAVRSPHLLTHLERRVATDAGGSQTLLIDADSAPPNDRLREFVAEEGGLRFSGNGATTSIPQVAFPHEDPFVCATGTECVLGPYIAFGIRDENHPSGHPGIDLISTGDAPVVASLDARVMTVLPDREKPHQVNVQLDGGALLIRYGHLDEFSVCCSTDSDPSNDCEQRPDAFQLCAGDNVVRGQRIARVAPRCAGNDVNASDYPLLATCSPDGDEPSLRNMHWGVGDRLELTPTFCPYDFMEPAGQARLEALAGAWSEVWVEPFICNDLARTSPSFDPPLRTRWTHCGTEPLPVGAPHIIRFVQTEHRGAVSYSFVDANGVTTASGTACGGSSDVTFYEQSSDCSGTPTIPLVSTVTPSGHSAELVLQLPSMATTAIYCASVE